MRFIYIPSIDGSGYFTSLSFNSIFPKGNILILSKKKYKAKVIPVGEDQRQHLEYTRDIVSEFNKVTKGLSKEYENFFPMPQVHYSKFFYYFIEFVEVKFFLLFQQKQRELWV